MQEAEFRAAGDSHDCEPVGAGPREVVGFEASLGERGVMNDLSDFDVQDGLRDLDAARHGAAHIIAALHLGQRFGSMGPNSVGWYEIVPPIRTPDLQTDARIALAGPCMDLAVELIEFEGDAPVVLGSLESWRDDLVNHESGYRYDMIAARGGAADAAAWSLAFCRVNFDLIDEAAMMLVHATTNVDYRDFAARLHGRTKDVDSGALDVAWSDFAGGSGQLDRMDEAVLERLSGSWVGEH